MKDNFYKLFKNTEWLTEDECRLEARDHLWISIDATKNRL